MLLDEAHHQLGWPAPSDVLFPPGAGSRVYADFARDKIEAELRRQHPGVVVATGILKDREVGDEDASLNLNHPVLRGARLAAIDAERQLIARRNQGRTVPASEREQRATEPLNQAIRPTSVSARVAWLRRQLGEGR